MPIPTVVTPLRLPTQEALARPTNPLVQHSPDTPASVLLTDFRHERASVVAPDRHVDAALNEMILTGVRALLVVEAQQVIGLITATDIMGPKPIQFLQNPLCDGTPCRHEHVHVSDVMTPLSSLDLLPIEWLESHTCADLATRFGATDTTHQLVVGRADDGQLVTRGIVSRTRLMRQVALT